jgi:hypothetical protein
LWHTVQQFLHELAWYAGNCGAQYINTDGYIFKARSGKHVRFTQLLDKLGLVYHWATGDGEILGWNSYKIDGVKETIPHKNGSKGDAPNNNITRVDGELPTISWWNRYCRTSMEREIINDYHPEIG